MFATVKHDKISGGRTLTHDNSLNPLDWISNLFGIVLKDQTFSIENQSYARPKQKSIAKELLFKSIILDVEFKTEYIFIQF